METQCGKLDIHRNVGKIETQLRKREIEIKKIQNNQTNGGEMREKGNVFYTREMRRILPYYITNADNSLYKRYELFAHTWLL